jgi:hypothetical protein
LRKKSICNSIREVIKDSQEVGEEIEVEVEALGEAEVLQVDQGDHNQLNNYAISLHVEIAPMETPAGAKSPLHIFFSFYQILS